MSHPSPVRRGLTSPETLIVTAIIAVLIGLLVPAVSRMEALLGTLPDEQDSTPLQVQVRTALTAYDSEIGSARRKLLALIANVQSLDPKALAAVQDEFASVEENMGLAIGYLKDALTSDDTLSPDDRKLAGQAIGVLQQARAAVAAVLKLTFIWTQVRGPLPGAA